LAELGLNYVRLEGNIGNIVNGAGLAMATNDLIPPPVQVIVPPTQKAPSVYTSPHHRIQTSHPDK
jgi:hypothetical protein